MWTSTLLLLIGVVVAQSDPVEWYCGQCQGPWTEGYGCTACYPPLREGDRGDAGAAIYVPARDQQIADEWNELAEQLIALTGSAYRVDPLRLRATIGPLDRAIETEAFAARADFDRARELLEALSGDRLDLETALERTRDALRGEERTIAVYELRRRKLDALCDTLDDYRAGARARACSRLEALRRQGKIASPLAYLPPPPPLAPRYARPAWTEPAPREPPHLVRQQPPPPELYWRPPDVSSEARRTFRLEELERAKDWRAQARDSRRQISREGLNGAVQDAAAALDAASTELAHRIRESERLRRLGDGLMEQAHAKMADATGWGLVEKILTSRGDALSRTQRVLELTLDLNGSSLDIASRAVQALGTGTVEEIQALNDELWDSLYTYMAAVEIAALGPNGTVEAAEWEKRAREHAGSSVQDVLGEAWKVMGGR